VALPEDFRDTATSSEIGALPNPIQLRRIKRAYQFTGSAIPSESHGSEPFASQFVKSGFSGGQRCRVRRVELVTGVTMAVHHYLKMRSMPQGCHLESLLQLHVEHRD
jgi:hypothetical protein